MAKFSRRSKLRLDTCVHELQDLMMRVVEDFDITIVCGYRTEKEQNAAYKSNNSTVKYPNSKHNSFPSHAVDVVPYPEMWESKEKFYYLAGYIHGIANEMGITIRWGGDWDMDKDLDDQSFMDLGHFEVRR